MIFIAGQIVSKVSISMDVLGSRHLIPNTPHGGRDTTCLKQGFTLQRGQLLLRADQRDRHARQKMCMHEMTTALSHLPRISPKPVQAEAISVPIRYGDIVGRNAHVE